MGDRQSRGAIPDRLRVFISSTIGECVAERAAVRRAIVGLNFEPVQFEREGARAEAPRDFYLRKLQDSHFVVGIYRRSYGWVDAAKGMTISGLEDEFREAQRSGKDLLAYVLKDAPDCEERLGAIIAEIMAGPQVVHFFEEGEDLEERVRNDLTTLISERIARSQITSPDGGSAGRVLQAIFKADVVRVTRTALLEDLNRRAALSRMLWIEGAAGSGKTALAAEWATTRNTAYVDGRGMDPRSTLLSIAASLGVAHGAELAIPMFEDARALLQSRWEDGTRWPLVLDDPDDVPSVWSALSTCLAQSGVGSVILITRQVPAEAPGERFTVPGLSGADVAALRAIAGVSVMDARPGDLPLSLRRTGGGGAAERFDALDPVSREALGYLALSPTILDLADLEALLGGSVTSATELADRLTGLSALLMENAAGYVFIHDSLRDESISLVTAKPQLNALLVDRLSDRLARTGRAWSAFHLRKGERSQSTERLANRAMRESVFSGSTSNLVDALEFLVGYYRDHGENGRLVSVLMALADARVSQGKASEAPAILDQAVEVAQSISDHSAIRVIEMLQASLELRRNPTEAALERIRALREDAARDGREDDEGRLLLDEGVAFLSVNEARFAIPLFRKAREAFGRVGNRYGANIADRNLIISLASTAEGFEESEALRASLGDEDARSPRYRAWLCNLLVPRLRRAGRFEQAEAMARDAIGIAETLGDRYLVAINELALGNVLREADDLNGALDAYSKAAACAQTVGRPELVSRSARLSALAENTAAEAAEGAARHDHALRAERHATRAIATIADSFLWGELAIAHEERGDAYRLQDRASLAMSDYAEAVRGYLKADDAEEVERLLQFFLEFISGAGEEIRLLAAAFGAVQLRGSPDTVWLEAVRAALLRCPSSSAPTVLGALVRGFLPGSKDRFWLDGLVRCLLKVGGDSSAGFRSGQGSMLLLAILGFSPHRDFRTTDLITLAGICLEGSDGLAIRHSPGSGIVVIVHLGKAKRLLFTIRSERPLPEAMFVTLAIAAFLDAFGSNLSDILSPDLLPAGPALDITVLPRDGASGEVARFFDEGLIDRPVATARITPDEGEEAPIVVIVRRDAMRLLQAEAAVGGQFELMLVRILDEVLFAVTGRSVDDAIFSSKVKELIMSVLR